jgi:hypothetical protein
MALLIVLCKRNDFIVAHRALSKFCARPDLIQGVPVS